METYFTYGEAMALVGKKVNRIDGVKGEIKHVDVNLPRFKATTKHCFMVLILWDDVDKSYPYDKQRYSRMVNVI